MSNERKYLDNTPAPGNPPPVIPATNAGLYKAPASVPMPTPKPE